MIDTHTHLNMSPLLEQAEDVYARAQVLGVLEMIVVGTDLQTSEVAIKLAHTYQGVYATVGIHPEVVETEMDFKANLPQWHRTLQEFVRDDRVKAIGEIGLDYCSLHTHENKHELRKRQHELLQMQIDIAKKRNLPITIHCRNSRKNESTELNAYDDLLTILHAHKQWLQETGFILHCVSGPSAYVEEALTLGAYISFAGNVTYPNATDIQKLLSLVPLDRLLLETDAPFLAPQTKRGKTNEPGFVTETATYIASSLGISYERVDRMTTDNAHKIFQLL